MSIEIGTIMLFKGYEELEDGQEEKLTMGEEVRVSGYSEETDNYLVESLANEDAVDNVFLEELEDKPETEAEAPATKPKRVRKAKPAPAAEEAEEAEAPVKAAPKKAAPKKAAAAKAPVKAPVKAKAETKATAKAETKAETKTETTGTFVVMDSVKDYVTDTDTAVASAVSLAKRITETTEQVDQSKFALGGTLAYIKEHKVFETEGFENIEAFCEDRLNLKARACQYYVATYLALTEAGVTDKDIDGIGMTKLRSLSGIIDKSNKRALLGKARKMNRDDLIEHVKDVKKNGKVNASDPEAPNYVKIPAMRMFADQGTAFMNAVEEAQKVYEVDNMAEATYHMATDWMQAQDAEVIYEDALASFNAKWSTDFSDEEVEDDAK
jgi:hypothetical protein